MSLVFLISSWVWAYVPNSNFILQNSALNRGEGVYSIEQDVRFVINDTPYSVREYWLVEGMNFMRLRIEGLDSLKGQVQGTWIYQRGQKFFRSESGRRISQKMGVDEVEPYFHYRSLVDAERLLINAKIVSASEFSEFGQPKAADLKTIDYSVPKFLRLSRVGGAINYAFGTPTPTAETTLNPGLWIEQDRFVVRKIRTPSQLEIRADQYTVYDKKLWFPQVRFLKWPAGSATLSLASAKSVAKTDAVKSRLQPTSLSDPKEQDLDRLNVKLPEIPAIRDFYTRLR